MNSSLAAEEVAGAGPAEQATARSLERIAEWNGQLSAVISVNPQATEIARELDRQFVDGHRFSALHGVPVLIKDNIETRELPTTAGSLALARNATGRDASVIGNLRSSGLVIVGKANLSEWANFRSERSSSGWSGIGGQTRNPYDTLRSPCGSSSGSAVAVAAGMVPLAVGTETDGSIICPASVNGIVGIKPTIGLISRRGIVPIAHSQDTAGPMATNVADAAHLLNAMVGFDPADSASEAAKPYFKRDYTTALKASGLRGKRIGVVRSLAGFHEAVDERLENAIAGLAEAGAEIIDDLEFPDYPEEFWTLSYDVLLYEFKHNLNQYLSGLPGAEADLTLEKLIDFNNEHASQEMKWFGQEVFLKAQGKGGLDSPEYREALALVQNFTRAAIDDMLTAHDLDLLISPSDTPAWSIDLVVGDHFLGGSSSFPAIAGYPHITVPMGQVHGLPVGLSFFGAAFSELVLLEAAFAYEQATNHARPTKDFGDWQPAVSEHTGKKNPSLDGILSEALSIPSMVGDGARCQVTEGEEGESDTCQ